MQLAISVIITILKLQCTRLYSFQTQSSPPIEKLGRHDMFKNKHAHMTTLRKLEAELCFAVYNLDHDV